MTFTELAMRLQCAPEDTGTRAVLDAHAMRTDGAGLHCACGWSFSSEQWCRRDELRGISDLIRDHIEPELAKARAA